MDQATTRRATVPWTIILAAGSSSRLGRPKQLLRKRAQTLLLRACGLAAQLSAANVVVVLGAQRARMQSHLQKNAANVRIVFNKNWADGLGASLAAGIRALPRGAQAALVLLCDQPDVDAGSLRRLAHAHRCCPATIVAASYAGRRGVPAIFPRSVFRELRALRADYGARELLNGTGSRLRVVSVTMPEAARDIDCAADASTL